MKHSSEWLVISPTVLIISPTVHPTAERLRFLRETAEGLRFLWKTDSFGSNKEENPGSLSTRTVLPWKILGNRKVTSEAYFACKFASFFPGPPLTYPADLHYIKSRRGAPHGHRDPHIK